MNPSEGRRSTFYRNEANCNEKLEKVAPFTFCKSNIPTNESNDSCNTQEKNSFEDRDMNSENYWIGKLFSIDATHSQENDLNTCEIDKICRNLIPYIQTKIQTTCPVDTTQLADCYIQNKNHILSCDSELKEFSQCIDKMLYDAVRKNDDKELTSEKKLTYTERFHRGY